ncbi:TonB-dependent receptor [Flavobacterium sp. 5]|uniref:TonB-dependent receptor n=1 Tax=Flavobacterium sp. 5 TaxID=2035199 RepID=UPI001E49746C|nr:TonB-dependent receptor [Flavobacterium sp. 5]
MRSVFLEIQSQTDYKFVYNNKKIDEEQLVSIKVKNKPLQMVLDNFFKGTNISYVLMDKQIILKSNSNEESNAKVPAKQVQAAKISGIVTDVKGIPLPGCTIQEKGTKNAASTDFDGKYFIDVTSKQSILVFSFLGFKSQEIAIGDRSKINVSLVEESNILNEIVVVGYGVQKKTNVTGAIATVSGKVLENRPVQNAVQGLQGMVAGLNITQSGGGGTLDSKPNINIRGTGTIGDGSSANPLILIDGSEGDLATINPSDIDNISVLKDAAASSIYGSRAPFGVILVTTKKGKSGKTIVNISSSTRISKPVLIPDILDSYSFANYFNDAFKNAGKTPFFTDERLQRIKDFMNGTITTTIPPKGTNSNVWGDGYDQGNDNVDWYKAVFKPSVISHENNVSISGGKEGLTYYLSGAYLDQPGFMNFGGDQYKRYNTTLRINADVFKWMSLTYTNRFIREDYARPSYMTDGAFADLARQGWPVLPLYDPNGYLYNSPSPALRLRDGGRQNKVEDTFVQQLNLVFKLSLDWKIKWDVTYQTKNAFQHWDLQYTYNHDVNGIPYVAHNRSEVHEDAYKEDYYNSNIYTDYTKSFGKHHFNALLGMQAESTDYRAFGATRQGVILPEITAIDATSGTDYSGKTVPPNVNGDYKDWSLNGYFGRIDYNYDGRYMIQGNLRYDGSSRYRSDNRWVWSPSVSLGWNVAREEFWKPLEEIVGMFKLRGSFGTLSNQNDANGNYYPTYLTQPIGIANGSWLVNGTRPNTASAPELRNKALTWETIQTWDVGVDFALFDNKLTGSFDYFNRETKNMVGPAIELPVILGTRVPRANNTDLETYGFDMNISWKQQLSNGFGYYATALLADNRTKITKYPNQTGTLSQYNAGELDGNIWGYQTIGIAKTTAEMNAHLNSLPNGGQNSLGNNWNAGDIMYKDVNGDGKIDQGSNTLTDHGDLVKIGNNKPRYTLGFDTGANYKGFDFRAFFQGVLKRDYWNDTPIFWGMKGGVWGSTGLVQHLDYFRDDANSPLGLNIDSYYPRPVEGQDKNQKAQSRYLINAAYMRLKNIQFGYSLSNQVVQKIGMTKVRIYFSADNVITWTKIPKMFDPETLDLGQNGNIYPLSTTYSIGVNLSL